uniref:RRM domain-containing protein n=1 Tax=Anopheles culicifacies TaxID=139723 RepID=A0A182M228_9DIPT
MGENKQHEYYFGNLPKAATVDDFRHFLNDYGKICNFEYRLHKCTYCPTKIAFIKFAEKLDDEKLRALNETTFQQKRLFVASTKSEMFFTPLQSVVVRYLNEHITEEDLYSYFEDIGTIECVQKPSHNYAYVSFKDNGSIKRALEMKKTLKGIEPYIVEVRRRISMFLEHKKPVAYTQLKEKCDRLDLVYDPAAENETTLLVTNIPRDTEEDDVIEFLGRFGKIVDWSMKKSATCVMSNVAYVTYQQPKMARTAFLHGPLNFQGFAMEVHNRLLGYTSNDSDKTVIIRRTSVYLTNDEIFESCSEHGRVEYIQRIDSNNYNTIVRLDSVTAAKRVMDTRHIAGEDVVIRMYTAKQYISPTFAPHYIETRVPPKRSRKEAILLHISDVEERKNMSLLPTTFNQQYFNPNPQYYRNEVQVWNYAPKQGLVEFREFFKKYGTVINMREQKEYNTSPIGVVFLSFDTKLEAKRVCKLNHSFMCSRRLLIMMADECISYDPQLCVKVSNLTEEISDEDVYDRFTMIGDVKYVFRPKRNEAIVCMAKEKWQARALKVMCVGRFPVVVSPLMSANNAPQHVGSGAMQQYPLPGPNMGPRTLPVPDNNHWYGGMQNFPTAPMGSMGPMNLGPGSWLSDPIRSHMSMPMSAGMIRPAEPMPMGPTQMGSQEISPRMQGLMQTVEAQMIKCKNFTTLPMMDQFNLVRDIVNQCISFPYFLSMTGDDKVRYLKNEPTGFRQLNIFTLFTYPEQLKMLSIIEAYYRSTSDPGSLPPPASSSSTMEPAATNSNATIVLIKDATEPSTETIATIADAQPEFPNDVDDDDFIPPAPSPPPLSFRSRSPSPNDDDEMWVSSGGSINGSVQQKLLETFAAKSSKRKQSKQIEPVRSLLEKPLVQVANLPMEVTKSQIEQIFSQYGKVKLVTKAKSECPDSNTMIIMYETMYQAYMAVQQNLTILQGRLIRVHIHGNRYIPSSDCGISVICKGPFSELAVYETFKSCGKILYMQTEGQPGNEISVIEFENNTCARAALKITYLHNGNRCKAMPHTFTT